MHCFECEASRDAVRLASILPELRAGRLPVIGLSEVGEVEVRVVGDASSEYRLVETDVGLAWG